jgi:hypothetical protein
MRLWAGIIRVLFTLVMGGAVLYGGWRLLGSSQVVRGVTMGIGESKETQGPGAPHPQLQPQHAPSTSDGAARVLTKNISGRSYARTDSGRSQGSDQVAEHRRVQFANEGHTDSNIR